MSFDSAKISALETEPMEFRLQLIMDVQRILEKHDLKPNPSLDQFFMKDEEIINLTVESAKLNKKDTVLEIGSGIGNLTKALARQAGKVIAFEVDHRFKPILKGLPPNVEMHYASAVKYFQLRGKFLKKAKFNKVVSNLPYSLLEPLLHNLTFLLYDKVILLIPLKAVKTIQQKPIFSCFFVPKIIATVPKAKFYPQPKTNSAVIDLIRREDPIKTKDLGLFLRWCLYQHEGQLAKNSLMFGLIKWHKIIYGRQITKNQARQIIQKAKINPQLLNSKPESRQIYDAVKEKFK
ncbi:MAG: hypothetical protein GXP43_01725 [bacterium]|nr:hypothetical protein [bacterium]